MELAAREQFSGPESLRIAGKVRREPGAPSPFNDGVFLPYLSPVTSFDTISGKETTPWCMSRGKRALDIAIVLLSLPILAPLMLLAAAAIFIESPGPVIFRQYRTGLMGQRFRIMKFRTMVLDAEKLKASLMHLNEKAADSPDFSLEDDPRVLRVGKFLRRTSIDEIPNLFNVLLGHMSIVGPRPTSFDVTTYKDWHLLRLLVPPGITGLWQISGRKEIDFDERVALDYKYIKNQSMFLDLKILFTTPLCIFKGRGAN
ncbi:MAG: sugar transferase [Candidatus Krumholzibacteriia bacterium]